MAEAKKMSEGLIDFAERFADVVDAAQGRGARKASGGAKWLILPAAGAGVYALATSSSAFARRTRKLMSRAKDRATDLPDADLFGRVKEVTGTEQSTSGTWRTQAVGEPRAQDGSRLDEAAPARRSGAARPSQPPSKAGRAAQSLKPTLGLRFLGVPSVGESPRAESEQRPSR